MNILSYEILANPEDRTHEVRLIVDGKDWIGSAFLGLDPPDLVAQLTQIRNGRLLLARCVCGVIGCDDLVVEIVTASDHVKWLRKDRMPVIFNVRDYNDQVMHLAQDRTWETISRSVERHINDIFSGKMTDDGYIYDWASTRIKPHIVTISVTKIRTRNC